MAIFELHTETFPAIYKRFAEVVGDRHWRPRVRLLEDEIRGGALALRTFTEATCR